VADLAPTLAEVAKKPFLGYGYGTRITTGPDANACILDNQWLGTLVEVGAFGALAWLWLFLRVLRRFGGAAKDDPSERGWLLAAMAASVTAYAVGMFTFDALSFIQVSFLLFIILGLGSAVEANARRRGHSPSSTRGRSLSRSTRARRSVEMPT
jgi:O-antigen ligase